MRVAVASMEGAYINHGLQAAEQFFVFDVFLSGISYVEKRENTFREHTNSRKAMHGVAELLRDCKVVCCTQAGADAVEFFARRGVELDMSDGPIDEKLKAFIESVF
ncbi:MAG TPA: NifB/NifX family molybdenum-iron cluster-binding protein [Candidatus Krumholzibacteria bacterium]|nr:NifB/NifX family molybdenum-iron cluster-binding protein [Candidatus Krumholzibacteria bacterium]